MSSDYSALFNTPSLSLSFSGHLILQRDCFKPSMFSSKLQPNTYHFLILHHFCQTKLRSAHLICSKANLLTPNCGEGECSIYCKLPKWSPSKENWQLMLKRPKILNGFQRRDFKSTMRERVVGSVVNSGLVI